MSSRALNEKNFHDIFKKIQQQTANSPLKNATNDDFKPTPTSYLAEWESALEPAWMAQLMSLPRAETISSTQLHNRNAQKKYAQHMPQRSQSPLSPAPRKEHALNEIAIEAYLYLLKYTSTPLSKGFSMRELKRGYRQALLKTHPDHGGSSEIFQKTKKSYEILIEFVKTQV